MADIGTKEASERWGYTQDNIRKWCAMGLITNATQDKRVRRGISLRMHNVRWVHNYV